MKNRASLGRVKMASNTKSFESAPAVDLFPVRWPDGETRYLAWPEATAAVVVWALASGTVSLVNWLATLKPRTLLVGAWGAAAVFVALFDDHQRR